MKASKTKINWKEPLEIRVWQNGMTQRRYTTYWTPVTKVEGEYLDTYRCYYARGPSEGWCVHGDGRILWDERVFGQVRNIKNPISRSLDDTTNTLQINQPETRILDWERSYSPEHYEPNLPISFEGSAWDSLIEPLRRVSEQTRTVSDVIDELETAEQEAVDDAT